MAFIGTEQRHPEQDEGEVFYTNLPKDDNEVQYGATFESIPYKSKRKGTLAFDIWDRPVESCYPVFVRREEIEMEQSQ